MPAEKRGLFLASLAGAVGLILGGFGPWVKFGPFSAAGTEGDGWFLVGAGVVAGVLLVRLNRRDGTPDRRSWFITVAGALGAIVVLIDLIEILESDFVTPGWGAWLGAIAGVGLVALSSLLLFRGRRASLVAGIATLVVAGGGIALGVATAETEDPGFLSESDDAETEPLFDEEEEEPPPAPPPAIDVVEQGFTQDGDAVSIGLILENLDNVAGTEITVTINLMDDAGTVIATETANASVIPVGAQFGVGVSTSVEGETVASVDASAEAQGSSDELLELPESRRARIIPGEFGDTARAEIRNTLDEPLSTIADVFFVYRNEAGDIVGGATTFPEADLPPGERTAVETGELPSEATSAEVYPDAETASGEFGG